MNYQLINLKLCVVDPVYTKHYPKYPYTEENKCSIYQENYIIKVEHYSFSLVGESTTSAQPRKWSWFL
jgi:hypothetical protein